MSLTIISSPQKVTPAGNTIMYVLDSNMSNFIYVNVRVKDSATSTLIATLRVYPTPANPVRVHIEVSKIMQSYVGYKLLDYYTTIVTTVPGAMQGFFLEVDEVILSGTGNVITASTQFPPECTVFKGELDPLTFKNYISSKYTFDSVFSYPILFSTLQPRIKRVLSTSDEGLYFFQNGFAIPPPTLPADSPRGKVTYYDKSGAPIGTPFIIDVGFQAQALRTQFRVNVSPNIVATYGAVPLANIGRYTFELIREDDTTISEVFTYIIEDNYCNAPPLHIYFVNKFGAIDTYTMLHPMNSIEVEKLTMQKPEYRLGANGQYNNFEGVTFNVVDAIVNTGERQSIRAITRNMTDDTNTWLSSLIYSPQIYIKVLQNLFIPVTVQETRTDITPRRYGNGLVTKEYTFKLAEGFTPDFKL